MKKFTSKLLVSLLVLSLIFGINFTTSAWAHPALIAIGTAPGSIPVHFHFFRHLGSIAVKGHHLALPGYLIWPAAFVGVISTLVIIYGPAWDDAKDNHTETAFQSRHDMIQTFFANHMPGGHPYPAAPVTTASAGNAGIVS